MFRVLNSSLVPSVPTLPTAAPDVRFFDLHGERVLFDANSLCAVHVDAETAEKFRGLLAGRPPSAAPTAAPPPPGAAAPHEKAFHGLLFSREKPQFRLARSTPVRRLVLNVTHACNLRCAYCFARDALARRAEPREAPAAMPFEVAQKALALLDPAAPIDLAFFGGEPLLAWDRVRQVIEAAETLAAQRKAPARFHITTNALALDRQKADFLASRRCSLLVSLDGPEALHNAARPARNRRTNSFRRTMRALEMLAGTPLAGRTMARATFTADAPRLVERLEFLAGLQDRGWINGFSVEPAVLGEGCSVRDAGGESPEFQDRTATEYHEAARWYVDRLKNGKRAGFFHFTKLCDRIRHARHAGTECGAGNGYITVAPDGTIFACHREGGRIGHVDYGIDEELRAPWTDNRLYSRAGCAACWARHLCGGGCRQACLELGGSLHADTPARCFLQRTLLEECLWILTQLP